MQVGKKHGKWLLEAISEWEKENVLSAEKAQELRESVEIRPFDWERLKRINFSS